MPEYCGTTSNIINWDEIVRICKECDDGDKNTVTSVVDRSEAESGGELLNRYRKLISIWENAGYNLSQIEWYDYYPGQHFDISVQDKIAEFVKAKPRRVFVSEVHPGKIIPWHWDVEDKEDEWLVEGDLIRYVVFMQPPQFGHVLPLEKTCMHNIVQGDVWKWDSYKSWHAGINMGEEPHYLFHFLGTPNE